MTAPSPERPSVPSEYRFCVWCGHPMSLHKTVYRREETVSECEVCPNRRCE